jgi:hypothetical protein
VSRGNSILSLCRWYQNLGTSEALSVLSKLPHWFANDSEEYISIRHLKQIVSIAFNHGSRMARMLMRAMIPSARGHASICSVGSFCTVQIRSAVLCRLIENRTGSSQVNGGAYSMAPLSCRRLRASVSSLSASKSTSCVCSPSSGEGEWYGRCSSRIRKPLRS